MRVIRVDDDVWRALKKRAEAFEDTPNSVLRRVLKVNGSRGKRGSVERLRRGERTPQEAFRPLILRLLYESGGASRTGDVLERVGELLAGKLTDSDKENLTSGEIRWRNTAQWERNVMVEEGLLKKDSARGIWELTEKGIQLAEQE